MATLDRRLPPPQRRMRSQMHMFLVLLAVFHPARPFLLPRQLPAHPYLSSSRSSLQSTSSINDKNENNNSENNNDGDDDDVDSDASIMAELSRRISDLSESERQISETFEQGLQRRVASVAKSDQLEAQARTSGITNLPAIAFDQLLPRQRLVGRTTDPTFGKLLRDLGLGGLFVMVSIDARARKVRRCGVIARIEYVDVDNAATGPGGEAPTAVDFRIMGRTRCRILGPAADMEARVGRWRRGHDPDGEEAVLGFAKERFLDSDLGVDDGTTVFNGGADFEFVLSEWTPVKIDVALDNEDTEEITPEIIAKAQRIVPMLQQWIDLASSSNTYNNVDVVASARIKKGEPGLLTDPQKQITSVLKDLGQMPEPLPDSTSRHLHEFCFWGAALINPLPPLGVSLEVRGRMLEATSIEERLVLLEKTVSRSIQNLNGTRPL